jgi:tol-pal system protein YbgF
MMFPRKALSSLALVTLGGLLLTTGCAHGAAGDVEAIEPEAAEEDSGELAKLRRENERLQRQLRQAEERIRLAKGDEADVERDATAPKRRRSASGAPYGLPVVKVDPNLGDGTRPTDSVALGQLPNSGVDERLGSNEAYGQSGGAGYGASGGSVYGNSDGGELPAYDDPAPAAPARPAASSGSSGGAVRSFSLRGSTLVKATREPPKLKQKAPPKSRRSKKSRHKDSVLAEYEAAMGVYKKGDFREAEMAFGGIVRNHASHDYADNALYWQGESAYDQAHYADALTAFTAVVERYGGGNKAPDALLKIGLCYGKLGDSDNARDVLTQLVAAYPRARASKIAKKRLADFSEG